MEWCDNNMQAMSYIASDVTWLTVQLIRTGGENMKMKTDESLLSCSKINSDGPIT